MPGAAATAPAAAGGAASCDECTSEAVASLKALLLLVMCDDLHASNAGNGRKHTTLRSSSGHGSVAGASQSMSAAGESGLAAGRQGAEQGDASGAVLPATARQRSTGTEEEALAALQAMLQGGKGETGGREGAKEGGVTTGEVGPHGGALKGGLRKKGHVDEGGQGGGGAGGRESGSGGGEETGKLRVVCDDRWRAGAAERVHALLQRCLPPVSE